MKHIAINPLAIFLELSKEPQSDVQHEIKVKARCRLAEATISGELISILGSHLHSYILTSQ